jgi:hypothetical protein
MWDAVSAYTTGGEEAVRAKGEQAATLLLEQLNQAPMSTIEMHERVRVTAEPGAAAEGLIIAAKRQRSG